jgi:uncharacterized membrane protein YbjE (DUF340 family)
LQRVNRLLSLLIYAILFFMGTSLAFLDNPPAPCASATADSAGDAAAATASGDPAATAPAASRPWHQPALLQRVNRLLSLLIYAILFFMGTSLAFLQLE